MEEGKEEEKKMEGGGLKDCGLSSASLFGSL